MSNLSPLIKLGGEGSSEQSFLKNRRCHQRRSAHKIVDRPPPMTPPTASAENQHKTQPTQKTEEQKRDTVARRWAGAQAFGLGLRPKAWAKTRARQGRTKNFKNHLRKYP